MANLLEETLEILEKNGKKPDDVLWCGTCSVSVSWQEFVSVADEDYHKGYGLAEIVESLVVVGDEWWLERHEYDGSEWWEYKELPAKPPAGKLESVLSEI